MKPALSAAMSRVARGLYVSLAASLLAYLCWGYVEARRLESRLEAIRAAESGGARASAEVGWRDNAARLYEAALVLSVPGEEDWRWQPFWAAEGGTLDAEEARRVRERLEENRLPLELLDTGRSLPFCEARDAGEAPGFHWASELRLLGRLGSLRTGSRLAGGDPEGAVASLASDLSLLRLLDSRPSLIGEILRTSAVRRVGRDVTMLLESGAPAPLAALQGSLAASRRPGRVARALLGERDVVWDHLEREGLFQGVSIVDHLPRWLIAPAMRHEAVTMLDYYADLLDALGHPWPQARERVAAIRPAGFTVGRTIGWQLPRLVEALTEASTLLDSTMTCVAVERFRRERGRVPELSDLVPSYLDEIPRDPFSGEPLRLASGNGRFTVYGVGRDSRDDGGRTGGPGAPYSPDLGTTVRFAR